MFKNVWFCSEAGWEGKPVLMGRQSAIQTSDNMGTTSLSSLRML